ncbi:MAG: hypothetical protein H6712_19935 [Myxococcales bacterium]|nr:hypothetical protein [Myxococcales bacterium]MCB9716147.1 hypothetical protein [Myxococcales bacterium]
MRAENRTPSSLRIPRPAGLAVLLLLGCPAEAGNPYATKPKPAPQVGADDPRVVEKDGELYPHKTIERAEERQRGAEDQPALGSGHSDETNGVCRLFSPELPDPECCKAELGFDMKATQDACDLHVYLGESHRISCGYYFNGKDGERKWFRLGKLPETSAKAAADHHDRKMREALGETYALSTPVPGVDGAYWSRHDQFRWAFLPGWDNVRQLSWQASSCSDEGITKVIAQIVAAKPAPPGSSRPALVPQARM